ncbi:MAG: hypothetical protein JOZ25_10180 [Actinobacteria bacterium]|nr:hypothetical protein [Actinomycetota bacterium]
MDERTDWVRQHAEQGQQSPPRFEGWHEAGAGSGPRAAGAAGPRVPDLSALLAVLDALRRVVPHELQDQLTALQRELLLTVRALIDWYLERLDKPELEPQVEDIPIE